MSFLSLLRTIVRGWYLPLVAVLLCVGAALALTRGSTPSYTADSFILVSPPQGADASALMGVVPTYAQLARLTDVLAPVAAENDVPGGALGLQSKVNAAAPTATTLIQVSAVDDDPAKAAKLSQGVAQRLTTYLTTSPLTKTQVRAQVVQKATVPTYPSSTPKSKILATAIILGLGLGVVLAVLVGALRENGERSRRTTRSHRADETSGATREDARDES